ncbi:MAG: iron-sulfur cluster assembly accessory protein [Ignavibacteria bacterium]|nr:iron-sulfur cluster assembly accessory protein [Ignavibacteria bacterium]
MNEINNTEFIPGVSEGVSLTPKAIKEVKIIMTDNNIPDTYGLRIGVKGGGCSGLTYSLGFDAESKSTDTILEIEGINVFIDMKSSLYLSGTQIDYSDGLEGKGFIFNNPNAKRTCGCGSSFSS